MTVTTQQDFFANVEFQTSPLAALTHFLDQEQRYEQAQEVAKMRFAGYVLELGYDTATIITSDPFKVAIGGIPRGSFLILAAQDLSTVPPHFTLLRVNETAPTPLSSQVRETYFELHKKSMPELDVWTQSELQWGALRCSVLGMFYPDVDQPANKLAFAGDVNSVVSSHRYMVYAPDEALLDLIVNGLVDSSTNEALSIGYLRPTENRLGALLNRGSTNERNTEVKVSVADFKGARTAMFGKTRLGKSNVVKLLAQAMIDASKDGSVGQLIFDINGEYANDNEVDKAKSIRSANPDRCIVYAMTKRPNTPSRPLKFNFYEQPNSGLQILKTLLEQDSQTSNYITSFASADIPAIGDVPHSDRSKASRTSRRIQIYWAILRRAGFELNEVTLKSFVRSEGKFGVPKAKSIFDPMFQKEFRVKVWGGEDKVPGPPMSIEELVQELNAVAEFGHKKSNQKDVYFESKFDPDDLALLNFLNPKTGTGPSLLQGYRKYHGADASDFIPEVLSLLDEGSTVILDLGNADETIRTFYSDMLSRAIFSHQETKFTSESLGSHYIHLYFEEAHNLFPVTAKDLTGVYARFAKEGAKFHIGMTYSTQSPSTIYGELLTQTENFFVGHLSSSIETSALSKLQGAFTGVEDEITRSKTPGFMRMLTQSHRFVIPVQAHLYETD